MALELFERYGKIPMPNLRLDENAAQAIDLTLRDMAANQSRLNSPIITELNRLMQRLSRTGLRQGDRAANISLPPLRKPVYILLHGRPDLPSGPAAP